MLRNLELGFGVRKSFFICILFWLWWLFKLFLINDVYWVKFIIFFNKGFYFLEEYIKVGKILFDIIYFWMSVLLNYLRVLVGLGKDIIGLLIL